MRVKKTANPSRRLFLKGSAAVAGGGLVGVPALSALAERVGGGQLPLVAGSEQGGYGPLFPTPDARDGVNRLALPEGFRYVTFGIEGNTMADGNPTPPAHDGMAAFALANGNVRLIRNHEDRAAPENSEVRGDPDTAYDPIGGGGTTSLEMAVGPDGEAQLMRDFISLNGTIVNCAGGPTPWNTWITCEETTEGEEQGWQRDHGFVFEVPVEAEDETQAVPLEALGRFVHEAVAVDPGTGIIYLTEDRSFDPSQEFVGAGFYRFLPDGDYVFGERPNLSSGRLQALRVKGTFNYNTTVGQTVGTSFPIEWVDVEDPNPPEAETDTSAVFRQALANGAAIFQRLEGCWYGNGAIYINSTSGGDAGEGQVWEFQPNGLNSGILTLLFESPAERVLDNPDNITVSPRAGVVLCEDGDNQQFLRGLTPDGRIFDFAENLANTTEWAGATFSPQGRTLFVNIQGDGTGVPDDGDNIPGFTIAIWGPWENGAL